MAPAQFVWLKLVDRNLWYALHSLGYEIEGIGRYIHPNPRVEALGARDHWAAERMCGPPILKPISGWRARGIASLFGRSRGGADV